MPAWLRIGISIACGIIGSFLYYFIKNIKVAKETVYKPKKMLVCNYYNASAFQQVCDLSAYDKNGFVLLRQWIPGMEFTEEELIEQGGFLQGTADSNAFYKTLFDPTLIHHEDKTTSYWTWE